MADWSTLAQVATALGLIVAICMFIWQIKSNRKERSFSIFLRLLDFYNHIMTERRQKWKTIKEKVKDNPKISIEIGDKTSSIDYLLIRIQQNEPLYAIEHGLFEDEIKSLNLLNELCKYAVKDEQKALILKVSYSSEISYYLNRLNDISLIWDKERQLRLFSIPRYRYLKQFQVGDYFAEMPTNSNKS